MNNCQIFTSSDVVEHMLNYVGYNSNLMGLKILENSFGSGNFLVSIVKRYISVSLNEGRSFSDVSNGLSQDIFGYEIDDVIFQQTITRLNGVVEEYGLPPVKWNLKQSDYLYDSCEVKFDIIVGNPPYIDYRDLGPSLRIALRSFESCKKGKFDYCYPFIEKSISELKKDGKLCFLVPNSIFKNVFASNLRQMIKPMVTDVYKTTNTVFTEKALVSPVIILLKNGQQNDCLKYHNDCFSSTIVVDKNLLGNKWIFSNESSIVDSKKRFGDYFNASLAMVTMCNEAFIIRNVEQIGTFYKCDNIMLEAELIHKAASPKMINSEEEELIIFPYLVENENVKRINRVFFEENYPGIARHLLKFNEKLSKRDVDKGAEYYEYGRSQSLRYINTEKLLMSTIITETVRIETLASGTVPYSGIIITSKNNGYDLDYARKILLSSEFMRYAESIGVSVSGSSVRITSKDINNYRFDEVSD